MGEPTKPRIFDRARRARRVFLLLGNYYQQNHYGIARYAKEAHWVLDTSYMRTGQADPLTQRVDGVIGLITRQRDLDTLRKFPRTVPLVDLSAAWGTAALPDQSGRRVPRVLYDNAAIARLAAQHFIGRGFVHIALLNRGDYHYERERKVIFHATIQDAGRTFHEIPFHRWVEEARRRKPAGVETRAVRRLAKELLKLPKPLAVFTPSDDIGLRVLHACELTDLRVPEEVAVLGCHNDPLDCNHALVPLSSVDDDLEMQGYEAARLLDRLMNHEPAPAAPIIIPPKGVVTRASTNILAVPHREVAIALRFIWQHYAEPIQTDDVAAAAGLSRYHLMRLFQTHLGRSITDEITHKRIEHAKQLLVETNLKAWQIAEQTGFSSIVHLSTTFSRIVGQAPSHFRVQHLQHPD
jgi:LacI family transcriptional regulator